MHYIDAGKLEFRGTIHDFVVRETRGQPRVVSSALVDEFATKPSTEKKN